MYQPLLTSRYLMTRMIPLLAVAAVAMCVALVIIVISVMTGFLDMVRSSGQTLMGDVVISHPIRGIPDYDRLINLLEKDASVAAATPVVDTWGLLRMPYPDEQTRESEQVQIWGINPATFSNVTGFADSLHWDAVPPETAATLRYRLILAQPDAAMEALDQPTRLRVLEATADDTLSDASRAFMEQTAASLTPHHLRVRLGSLAWSPEQLLTVLGDEHWRALHQHEPRLINGDLITNEGLTLERNGRPAIVSGLHVSKANERTSEGTYRVMGGGHWWMPSHEATLTTLPIDSRGGLLEPKSIVMPFANEFSSGVYVIDESRVMIPIDIAQDLTQLSAADKVDPNDPTQIIGSVPARATMVLIRGVDGVDPIALKQTVESAYHSFENTHTSPDFDIPPFGRGIGVSILTWEEQNASFIGPVEKERELMRTLFSIVYLVCGALIVAIFWAIVYEKTRDIGILRSVGATRFGIVLIFLL